MAGEATPLKVEVHNHADDANADGFTTEKFDFKSTKLWIDISIAVSAATFSCVVICCLVRDATTQGVWVQNSVIKPLCVAVIAAVTAYFTYFYVKEGNNVKFFTRFGTIGGWTAVICYLWCIWTASRNMPADMKHLRG